jgi:DNA repair protein RecO (recombination protein O)
VAKGVHRKAHGGQPAQLLQVFYPLLVGISGRSELKQLTRIEAAGTALRPEANATLCGLYVNELMLRLLPRFDPQPELFAAYGEVLRRLEAGILEPALRRFEVTLLESLGYSINWRQAWHDQPVSSDGWYEFRRDQGFVPVVEAQRHAGFSGAVLLDAAAWVETAAEDAPDEIARCIKSVTRQALQELLGDRPLATREMAKSLDWGARG